MIWCRSSEQNPNKIPLEFTDLAVLSAILEELFIILLFPHSNEYK